MNLVQIISNPLYTIAFTLLLYVSVFASPNTINKGIIDQYEGYQCSTRFFTKEFLQAAIMDAMMKISASAPSFHLYNNAQAPETYPTLLRLSEEEGGHFLWRLQLQEHNLLATRAIDNISLAPPVPPASFLVLSVIDLEPLNIIQESFNGYRDCEAKSFASETSRDPVITGFRCADKIFTPHAVSKGLSLVLKRMKKKKWKFTSDAYPLPFDGRSTFGTLQPLYLWPINTGGLFNNIVLTSIVLDKNGILVGMVQKKDSKGKPYLKCQPTLLNKIEPQFVDSEFQQQPKPTISGGVDVFQCISGIIKSDHVLAAAAAAADGFVKQRRAKKRKYPLLFLESFSNGPEDLYEWPAIFDGTKYYSEYQQRFSKGIVLLVTDFCDVAGVLEYSQNYRFTCQRKLVPREIYEQSTTKMPN